jgi:hypothetical protein
MPIDAIRAGCENRAVRYYDLDGANRALSELRDLLEQLRRDRDAVARTQLELRQLSDGDADDVGRIAARDQREAAVRDLVHRMHQSVNRLSALDVTLRDIDTGLIDFPALAGGRPIWLCWRLGEGDIDWWHGTDEGFAGRKPIAELGGADAAGPVS